tara:strand:+ start:3436 stop:5673 length:2238 start_codon:yes stop_codon:yes gene_type:complete
MSISLVIPTKNDFNEFEVTIKKVFEQTLTPNEIIIVDSSTDDKIHDFVKQIESKIIIKYKRVSFAFPGKARNIGINMTTQKYIAFLDTKTIPEKFWLKDSYQKLKEGNFDICFGNTKFLYNNYFQKLLRATSYGSILHITTPGTLLKKNIFQNNRNLFIENVKAGEDIEWRQRLLINNYKVTYLKHITVKYNSLPNNIFGAIKKYFLYSLDTAFVDVQKNIKLRYLSILLFLVVLTIPRLLDKYNYLQAFISSSFKFYIISFSITIVIYIILLSFWPNKFKSNLFNFFILFLLGYFVYNWNGNIAFWVENSLYYIPHITKIFIFFVFILSIILRGLFLPISRKIDNKFLFPFNWIIVGCLGLVLDLIKVPGYIIGSLIPSFLIKINTNTKKLNKIIFFTKYGIKSASYRYRFMAFKPVLFENDFEVIDQALFDDKFFEEKILKGNLNYFNVVHSYIKRILYVVKLRRPVLAIIHIELLPFLPNILEFYLKLRKIHFIVDLDDAVYHRFEKQSFKLGNYLITKKFYNMINLSSAAFCGNKYHLNYFKRFNKKLYYLPTVTDLSIYNNYLNYNKYHNFTIVWIGTPSTTFYLNMVTNVLNKLKNEHNIDIIIIGSKSSELKNLNCKFIDWNLSNELEYLTKSHVGIMPLYDTKWEKGKCGFKIIQYMSLKIPVIASPIGVNKEIIKDNFNGLLANNENEWFDKILLLKNNKDFYNKISLEGYKTIEKNFSLQKWKSSYIDYINNIIN